MYAKLRRTAGWDHLERWLAGLSAHKTLAAVAAAHAPKGRAAVAEEKTASGRGGGGEASSGNSTWLNSQDCMNHLNIPTVAWSAMYPETFQFNRVRSGEGGDAGRRCHAPQSARAVHCNIRICVPFKAC